MIAWIPAIIFTVTLWWIVAYTKQQDEIWREGIRKLKETLQEQEDSSQP